jgi:hypothetical protein|tara:strand:- start:596 stop:814 length:219 start_codon:yes stop_codon:yes gene_type:complete
MNSKRTLERRRRERGEATDGNVGAGTSAPEGNVGAGSSAPPPSAPPPPTPSPGPIVSDDRDAEDKVGVGVTH